MSKSAQIAQLKRELNQRIVQVKSLEIKLASLQPQKHNELQREVRIKNTKQTKTLKTRKHRSKPVRQKPTKTGIFFGKDEVKSLRFESGKAKTYTREEIRTISREFADKIDTKFFSVSVHYERLGWKNAGYTDSSSPINLYDPTDSDCTSEDAGFIDAFEILYG